MSTTGPSNGSPKLRSLRDARWRLALAALWVVLAISPSLAAQLVDLDTDFDQWAGPYTLAALDVGPSGGVLETGEIAHAAVLPPPIGDSDSQRVVFFVRHLESPAPCATNVYGRSWIWNPDRPSNAALLPITPAAADGSDDVFCSGHSFDANGNLLVFGGLNYDKHCDPTACGYSQPFGHKGSLRLSTSTSPPVWVQGPLMDRERWYPTAVPLPAGDMFVAGHGSQAEPGWVCPLPPGYGETINRTFEFYRGAAPSFDPSAPSRPYGGNCTSNFYLAVDDYPRLHLLSNGNIIFTNKLMTAFMNILTPVCNPPRWQNAASSSFGPRHGGNTVHFVYRDPIIGMTDVVYAIGGTNGSDDDPCPGGPAGLVTDSVERMTAPSTGTPWFAAPSMTMPRYNHNAVILPTGAIFVVGGRDFSGGACIAGVAPERYRPPEIFTDVTPGSAADAWKLTVPQQHKRYYHSVAGLLPDGRVFSAGGQGEAAGWHSVELFSPSYMFFARPTVTNWPDPTLVTGAQSIVLGSSFSITATLTSTEATIERVALLRNTSVTHAQDMNQRYVVLDVTQDIVSGSTHTMTLSAPAAPGYGAPPGYYVLFVVQRTNDPLKPKLAPSEGRWVKLVIP